MPKNFILSDSYIVEYHIDTALEDEGSFIVYYTRNDRQTMYVIEHRFSKEQVEDKSFVEKTIRKDIAAR